MSREPQLRRFLVWFNPTVGKYIATPERGPGSRGASQVFGAGATEQEALNAAMDGLEELARQRELARRRSFERQHSRRRRR